MQLSDDLRLNQIKTRTGDTKDFSLPHDAKTGFKDAKSMAVNASILKRLNLEP